jgi:saccharopine dehydrogenase (NAD+, L-lysine forming)
VKVAVLGAGGLGRIIALELASDRRVSELLLVDRRGDRSRALKSLGRSARVTAIEADVSQTASLREILRGADVVVNSSLPEHNLAVMSACHEAGCNYIDSAGFSPVGSGMKPGVLEQLALDASWRDRGLTGIVSLGSDPGLSNVMARVAADRLEVLQEIRILKGHSGEGSAEGYPLYSREIFLRDALSPPTVWDGTKLVERPHVSDVETYAFPTPIGNREVYNFYHEEVITLPIRLSRPVGGVCYKHDIRADLVRAAVALDALGLLSTEKKVRIGAQQTPFRDAFLETFPEPSTFVGPMAGAMGIIAEVRGSKPGGDEVLVRGSAIIEHREANRRRGTTAERFVTAAAVASGIAMMADGKILRHGVLAPEELPPERIVPELEARGIRFVVEELAA